MNQTLPLNGRQIAVPESRQLNLFARMLEARGAGVRRCPLVGIHDAPDPAPVEAWLREFSGVGCDDLVLLTGEGLRRLDRAAERVGGDLRPRFLAALKSTRTVTRGPKPARALRELGLRADLPAAKPTTEGVIQTLSREKLAGRTVGVQLYGTDPNRKLMDFLTRAGASALPVAPYVYADEAEDAQVAELIRALTSGVVDAIAFTSSPQIRRLFSVARKIEQQAALRQALGTTLVAAVGPVVAATLDEHGVAVDAMPESGYFMKPLVNALSRRLGPAPAPD